MNNKFLPTTFLCLAAFAVATGMKESAESAAEKAEATVAVQGPLKMPKVKLIEPAQPVKPVKQADPPTPVPELPVEPEPPQRVVYVTEAQAKASPKPDLYIVHLTRNCPPCIREKHMLATSMFAVELADFDVIHVGVEPGRPCAWAKFYGISRFPAWLFRAADGRVKLYQGYAGYGDGTQAPAAYLLRIKQATESLK